MISDGTHADLRGRDLWIVGCYRSGTTLLEKLVHAHPRAVVASQPFSTLYFHAKQAFLDARGLHRRYPLGHLFRERDYGLEDFYRFLDDVPLSGADVAAAVRAMERYASPRWTPEIIPRLQSLPPGPFVTVWRGLNDGIRDLYGAPAASFAGSKEVLCEEYAPYLLRHGATVIGVIRDPRDMVASYNYRIRSRDLESNRPLLFSVRAWRRSVAIFLAMLGRPGFTLVRYEDLCHDPAGTLRGLADALGLEQFPDWVHQEGPRAQDGSRWEGNSSFEGMRGIRTSSVGRFRAVLPEQVLRYIEYTCAPEMDVLGYPTETSGRDDERSVDEFVEDVPEVHPRFEQDYSSAPGRRADEVRRRALARARDLDDATARSYFITLEAHRAFARSTPVPGAPQGGR
jgi:hypothetical protein